MPTIPYPDVPNYPGVPAIPRTSPGSPTITMSVAPANQEWINQTPGAIGWGIFTPGGVPIYTPTEGGTLSVYTFGVTRSMQVSDFPIEANVSGQGAACASFNKVFQPYKPIVTLALSGTDAEKIAFLSALDDACSSTDLWNVHTPDQQFAAANGACTVDRYSYQRSATRGATMLIVEVSLTQVLQVSPTYTNQAISSPQSPSATGSVNNGITQPSAPAVPASMLSTIAGALGVGK